MIRLLLIPLLAAAGTIAPHAWSDSANHTRCSIAWVPIRSTDAFFVGEALADTVAAGPGTFMADAHPGSGDLQGRRVYGQVVRVRHLNPNAPISLHAALASADQPEVVMIPWSYDPACQPRYWRESARWLKVGEEDFFEAVLRPEALWLDGRPTLDVRFPSLTPYSVAPPRREDRGETGRRLTPLEYFGLYMAMPTPSEWRAAAPDAARRVEVWQEQNPDLAELDPARTILRVLKTHFQTGR